jgi:hypothetical protein
MQKERDDLYNNFVQSINEVQQKSSLKNVLLEKKVSALADSLEKREAQLNEVLSASKLDPASFSVMTRKLEVRTCPPPRTSILYAPSVAGSDRCKKHLGNWFLLRWP